TDGDAAGDLLVGGGAYRHFASRESEADVVALRGHRVRGGEQAVCSPAELLDVWPVDHVDDDVIAEVRPQHLQVEQGVAPVLADGRLVWPSQRNARGFGQRRAESDPCIRCAAAQQVRDVEGTVQREIAAQTPR